MLSLRVIAWYNVPWINSNTIHRINHYPVDNVIDFSWTYPLGSDLSTIRRLNNRPWLTRYVTFRTFSELSFRKILLQATHGFFKMRNTKIIPESDSHVKVTGMLVANLESRTEFDLGVAYSLFDSRGDRVKVIAIFITLISDIYI